MKKKYPETPLVEEYLESISKIKHVETDAFFYTRLKIKMEKRWEVNQPQQNIKWGFAVGILAVFFIANCWMLAHQYAVQNKKPAADMPQSFAEIYSIGNSLSY